MPNSVPFERMYHVLEGVHVPTEELRAMLHSLKWDSRSFVKWLSTKTLCEETIESHRWHLLKVQRILRGPESSSVLWSIGIWSRIGVPLWWSMQEVIHMRPGRWTIVFQMLKLTSEKDIWQEIWFILSDSNWEQIWWCCFHSNIHEKLKDWCKSDDLATTYGVTRPM